MSTIHSRDVLKTLGHLGLRPGGLRQLVVKGRLPMPDAAGNYPASSVAELHAQLSQMSVGERLRLFEPPQTERPADYFRRRDVERQLAAAEAETQRQAEIKSGKLISEDIPEPQLSQMSSRAKAAYIAEFGLPAFQHLTRKQLIRDPDRRPEGSLTRCVPASTGDGDGQSK